MRLTLGQFVAVGPHTGVVVGLCGNDLNVPEDHVAIWYGEISPDGKPLVKTVPAEYANPPPPIEYYH